MQKIIGLKMVNNQMFPKIAYYCLNCLSLFVLMFQDIYIYFFKLDVQPDIPDPFDSLLILIFLEISLSTL